MASATLTHDSPADTVCTPTHDTATVWWRRGHSYAFAVVIALEIAATWAVVRVVELLAGWAAGWESIPIAAMIGFLFAQCFLLGLWAALGGLGTVPRWLIAGLVSTLGGLAIASQIVAGQWLEFLYQGPIMALLAGLTAAGFAVVLIPLRRLAGWRVNFDASYHPSTGRRRGQLDMMDFAAMFCAVALPLALGRSLVELMGEDAADIGVIVPIFGALVLTTAAPVAYALLTRRHSWWLVLGGCVAWLAIVCIVQSALTDYFPDLDIFDGRGSAWFIDWTVAAFHVGVAAAVGFPLALLRCWGLRLLVAGEQNLK